MRVTKRFRFESAHHLPGYPGKCARPHGHGYRLEVTVAGPIRDDGLVFDFYDLKRIVTERVIDRLDHRDLNELLDMPSAENVAVWIWGELKDLPIDEIKLFETEDAWVTLREGDA
jgi:6-pyruvoyltetrahydropterin/6-carboxytetrahydropterin synthase